MKGQGKTHSVLAESEGHLSSIATDLDKDSAVFLESLEDGSFK